MEALLHRMKKTLAVSEPGEHAMAGEEERHSTGKHHSGKGKAMCRILWTRRMPTKGGQRTATEQVMEVSVDGASIRR